ncbi:MAG TPA: alpha/beta hydrolase [Beijerinckiaceae bacterium]|nr:alpha/beta hydrolase [Beijerinckiaceae bacterium]
MEFFKSGDVRIAYIDVAPSAADRGEPILLIHGFASNHAVNWVSPLWVDALTRDGRRVVAFDNRGHGQSEKLYDPAAYAMTLMAQDALGLLAHLGIERTDVMGYSMGARIAGHLALAAPDRVRSVVFGGIGDRLVGDAGLPGGIAEAMEAPALDSLTDPTQRMFRAFAEANRNDLAALAACSRGARDRLAAGDVARIDCPALVAVGTSDRIAGSAQGLADLLPRGASLDIPGRDHNRAVGDKVFKTGVLAFLAGRP